MAKRFQILIAALTACAATALAAPRLNWLNPTHNFGAFSESMGKVTCTFLAVNVGDEPAVVLDARANCGCTRPRYDKRPVAPGDTLRVTVSYDPSGRPGRFHKQVRVNTNAIDGPATLNIRGTVIGSPQTLNQRYPVMAGNARLSNDLAAFGSGRKGSIRAASIQIYNVGADSITPAVADMPGYINTVFTPSRIAPGEQGILSLTAYTDRCPQWGVVEDSFSLIPDSRYPDSVKTVQTVVIVNEDFSKMTREEEAQAPKAVLSTDMIDFGKIDRSAGQLTRSFEITNAGHQPLILRRVYSADRALQISVPYEKIKPGKSEKVTLTLDPAKIPADELLNARISVITNSPSAPNQNVRVVGQ